MSKKYKTQFICSLAIKLQTNCCNLNKMMKKLSSLVVLSCLVFSISKAQFYYNDIYAKKLINQQMKLFKTNAVKTISVKKLDTDNETTNDFSITKNIDEQYKNISTISTIYGNAFASKAQYNNLLLINTSEEKRNIFQTTSFTYNNQNLSIVLTETFDSTVNESMFEEHKYIYNAKGVVLQMLKVKNETDTMLVNFKADEQGNIIEEEWLQAGRKIETYYYYYNEKNQLTDVVRFNKKQGKLLPEMLFEYNENGQLYKFFEIPYGSSNYNVWAYFYLPNGLKDKELLYNKSMELQGKLIYSYTYQ